MAVLTVETILAATGGNLICGNAAYFTGVCIDSRKIQEGELFVALKGERFDGHDFLSQALEKGNGAIVHSPRATSASDKTVILVKDTLIALQNIARFVRAKKDIPVVAITGSNGKTTTKDLIAAILGTQFRVLKSTGNLNNHIGLPMSMVRMSDEDEVAVLEMGASKPGDIKELCAIAKPDYGVLTNIGSAHLEGFGDIQTVRKTKLELLESVSVAVVNADDRFLMDGIPGSGFSGSLIRYGIHNPADIRASDIIAHEQGSSFSLHLGEDRSISVRCHLAGMFNIYNILAAAAIGYLFRIESANIRQGIESFTGVPMRMEIMELHGMHIISDVYNANPSSMDAAVRELARMKKGRSIAVLGDMLELGSYEQEAHQDIGRLMSELLIDIFIAVGPRMASAASVFRGVSHTRANAEDAGKLLKDIWRPGDTILIKGSRGMRMEKVLEA